MHGARSISHSKRTSLCVVLLAFLLATLYGEASGQNATDKDVQQVADDIRAIGALPQSSELRTQTIGRKAQYVEALKQKLDATQNQGESATKKRRLSLFGYQLLLAEGRLADEKLKLWQTERMIALRSKLDTSTERQEILDFLKETEERRREAAITLLDRSIELAPLITDDSIRAQFNNVVAQITRDSRLEE